MMQETSGERQLAFAVLEDALARLAGANPEKLEPSRLARTRREAREWFERQGGAEEPFTFAWVCDAVGLAAGPLRRAALAGRLDGAALRVSRLGYAPPRGKGAA